MSIVCFRLMAICCILCLIQFAAVNAYTIDERISNAAKSTGHFGLVQGNEEMRMELDMIFTPEQWKEIQRPSGTYGRKEQGRRHRRKAIRGDVYRWPNKVIPYELAPGVFSSRDEAEIYKALDEWQRYTCLHFRRTTASDRDRLRFDNGGGCLSYVGKVGGPQTVFLAPGCRYKALVVHEVGHAVGFQHEQTRPDRDDYVKIHRENIRFHQYFNFKKASSQSVNTYGVPYDYKSIMHYGPKMLSANGNPTIETLDPRYQDIIGNSRGLSFRDIQLANLMYQCNGHCSNKNMRCPGEGFVDKNCRCMCPGNPVRECSGTGTESEGCADRRKWCSTWARRGGCGGSKAFMSSYCKKSCELCVDDRSAYRGKDMRPNAGLNTGYRLWNAGISRE